MTRILASLLLLASVASAQNPGPMDSSLASTPPCVEPAFTYVWVPAAGCSTSTPCATDVIAGNNASQTSSGALPTYGATCGPNSTPCLTFNGTSDYIVPTTAIPSGLTTFTFYAVLEFTTGSLNNTIFGGQNNGALFAVDASNQMHLSEQGVADAFGAQTLIPNTWYTQIVTYDNGSITSSFFQAVGGSTIAEGTYSQGFSFSNPTTELGAATVQATFFTGKIAEWGYANAVTTAGIANWSSCHYGV